MDMRLPMPEQAAIISCKANISATTSLATNSLKWDALLIGRTVRSIVGLTR